jgi:hypothetical protein
VNLSAIKGVVESLAESGPLQDDGGDQEIHGYGAVTVLLQKCHQEAEANEHHDVHILKHFEQAKSETIQFESQMKKFKSNVSNNYNHLYLDSSGRGCFPR